MVAYNNVVLLLIISRHLSAVFHNKQIFFNRNCILISVLIFRNKIRFENTAITTTTTTTTTTTNNNNNNKTRFEKKIYK